MGRVWNPRSDISYGVYVYHYIFINIMVELGLVGFEGLLYMLVSTIVAALLSWHFIEKRALTWRLS